MSKDDVGKLFGKIEKDSSLRKRYADLIQAHQEENEKRLAEKLVELGKTSGFDFSKDDLLAARVELIDRANSGGELSEKDLANVAGGARENLKKGQVIAMSILTLGISCAAYSLENETKIKGSCGNVLSVTAKCES